MIRVRTTTTLLAALFPSIACTAIACIACAACHRDDPAPAVTSAPVAATGALPPRDHLSPGELLEGTDEVFGLRLPRSSKIESSFPQQVIASCPAKAADVANYLRPRVSMGTVSVGAASTIFERVQVPANPGHELVIRVEEATLGSGSRITVRDVTAPALDPSLTEEQRWKQVGLSPGGGTVASPPPAH